MIEKLTDAATMFWQALDERERMLLMLAGLWIASSVYLAASESRRSKNEERLLDRLRLELRTN